MHVFVLQIPLYPISMFQSEHDGEGMNLVMYFKLSESYSELPSHFRESITVRFVNYKNIVPLTFVKTYFVTHSTYS